MNKAQIVEEIYETVKCHGLTPTIYKILGKKVKVNLRYSQRSCDEPIEELNLSVRAYNALRRTGFDNVGKVIDAILENKLDKIRNLGKKSIVEIQVGIMEYGYEHLNDSEKKAFIRNTLQQNGAI